MTHTAIIETTLQVFKDCGVRSFPVDCIHLLKYYGYKIYTYRELKEKNEELYDMCMSYSEDAFQDSAAKLIAYNDTKPDARIRFSLMHELGHHMLGHSGALPAHEREANIFASNLLAPRMAIHYARCRDASAVARLFGLSYTAADHAFCDYRQWYFRVSYYHMTPLDRKIYTHFFDPKRKMFVWKREYCDRCGALLLNGASCSCHTAPDISPVFTQTSENRWLSDDNKRFQKAMAHWLYGE